MSAIVIGEEMLNNLIDRVFLMGKKAGAIEAGDEPMVISKNKATKIYGAGNVRKWINSGLVKAYKDVDGKRNSVVRLKVLELEAACNKCNIIKSVSPKEKMEMADIISKTE